MSVTRLQVAGVDLELFEAGNGAPLLFLHGASGFAPEHPYVAPLSAKHRLIAPSHPGFGAFEPAGLARRVDDIAHIYLELLDRLELAQRRHGRLLDRRLDRRRDGDQVAGTRATPGLVGPVGVKVGPADKLDIPDIFAHAAGGRWRSCSTTIRPGCAPDPSKMTDEQLAVMFRNRETLALLVWEP